MGVKKENRKLNNNIGVSFMRKNLINHNLSTLFRCKNSKNVPFWIEHLKNHADFDNLLLFWGCLLPNSIVSDLFHHKVSKIDVMKE